MLLYIAASDCSCYPNSDVQYMIIGKSSRLVTVLINLQGLRFESML